MLPSTLTTLVFSLLNFFAEDDTSSSQLSSNHLRFELRHLHASSPAARIVFSDVHRHSRYKSFDVYGNHSKALEDLRATYTAKTRRAQTHRPRSFMLHDAARLQSMRHAQTPQGLWLQEDTVVPDVEDRETLLTLAKITNNAYYANPDDAGWYDLGEKWNNNTYPVGWEPDADGFRGHVFATPDNSTIVLSIKGTSAPYFGGGGPTIRKDKQNDNLLFSCCCARVGVTWSTVCGCYRGKQRCDQDCVEDALTEDSLFYPVGTNLYNNLTYMYPNSNIWVVGHSLGGGLASLIGATFGAPVVAFEAPGERMAAQRLHLPTPPSTQHITHVYNNADPIPMGACTGVLSVCSAGGYALESRCHLGKTILYDTVSNASWSVGISAHQIERIIKLLEDPWQPSVELGREVPQAMPEDDCVDCYSWEFGSFPE
ncbi:hypothetical protein HGRIS_003397 [Hohenbuehelia grisea]|uniref:triacylglycerol lipase n=1 Tax=Hohenbuehelia grisea TaxID=104357 RepID=A0ABR3JFR8_9AGAR